MVLTNKFEINGIVRKKDKVTIIGAFEDPQIYDNELDNDVWILPQTLQKLLFQEKAFPTFDYMFEIHTLCTRKPELLELYYNEWHEFPKIAQKTELPNSFKYPLDEMISTFKCNYFLNSFNYLIALAIYMDYKTITLRGVNMIMMDDLIQRWSLEYWLGRAHQAGIDTYYSDNCDLLKAGKLYGYEADNTLAVYMLKYISVVKTDIYYRLKDMLTNTARVINDFKTLNFDNEKFMREILDRHEVERITQKEIGIDEEE